MNWSLLLEKEEDQEKVPDTFFLHRFTSDKEMYSTYKKYYGEGVNESSEVKIIFFDFKTG